MEFDWKNTGDYGSVAEVIGRTFLSSTHLESRDRADTLRDLRTHTETNNHCELATFTPLPSTHTSDYCHPTKRAHCTMHTLGMLNICNLEQVYRQLPISLEKD